MLKGQIISLVVVIVLATILSTFVNVCETTEINFIFDGMIRPAGVGNGESPTADDGESPTAAPTLAATAGGLSCEDQLAYYLNILNSQWTLNALSLLMNDFSQVQEDYYAAVNYTGASLQSIDLDYNSDLDIPTAVEDMITPPWFSSCFYQLLLVQAQLEALLASTALVSDAIDTYNALTTELGYSKRSLALTQLRAERAAARSVLRCGESSSKGFDFKVISLIATRTENCDGTYTVFAKASALGFGFLDVNCRINSATGATDNNNCKTGSRVGVGAGFVSAFIYYGLIFSGTNGRPVGMYFKPEVCYWVIFSSDCTSTTWEYRW